MSGKRTPMETPEKPGLLQTLLVKLVPQSFALMQRSQASVEIRKGPKGTVEFTVKCYADSIETAKADGLQAFTNLNDHIRGLEKSNAE